VELVQSSQRLQHLLECLDDRRELEDAVNEDVTDRQEPDTDVAEVDRKVLRLRHLGRVEILKEILLRVFLSAGKTRRYLQKHTKMRQAHFHIILYG